MFATLLPFYVNDLPRMICNFMCAQYRSKGGPKQEPVPGIGQFSGKSLLFHNNFKTTVSDILFAHLIWQYRLRRSDTFVLCRGYNIKKM